MAIPAEIIEALKAGVTAGTLVKMNETPNAYEFTFHSPTTDLGTFEKIGAQFAAALKPLALSGTLDRNVGIAIQTWKELTQP